MSNPFECKMQVPGHRPGASQAPTVRPSPQTNATGEGPPVRFLHVSILYEACLSQAMICGELIKSDGLICYHYYSIGDNVCRVVPEYPGGWNDQRWGRMVASLFCISRGCLTPAVRLQAPSCITSVMHHIRSLRVLSTRDYHRSM